MEGVETETQVKRCIKRQRKKLGGLFTSLKRKQKGKDLERFCGGMIRNLICLRLQRRQSKLVRILYVSSA